MRPSLQPSILLCQLFQLDSSPEVNEWVYQTIGYASISDKNELIITQKDTGEEVHKHSIVAQNGYVQSDEDAIQFSVGSNDYALSFENKLGAVTTLANIKKINSEQEHEEEDIQLTPVNESTLGKIVETMNQFMNNGQQAKTMLSQYLINKKGYLEQLQQLFETLEETKSPLLPLMAQVVKIMVSVAEHELFQLLLSDQLYLFIFGALEYDHEMQVQHRKYLQTQAQFVQVVPVKSKDKQRLIHFIYRLQYMRDCALAYYIDELQLIFIKINCYADLIKYMETSKDFLLSVIDALRGQNLLAVRFLAESLFILKDNPDIPRVTVHQRLSEFGLYEILEEFLVDKGFEKLKSRMRKNRVKIPDDILATLVQQIMEILLMTLHQAPQFLRAYAVNEHQQVLKYPFMSIIVDIALSNPTPCNNNTLRLLVEHSPQEDACNDTAEIFQKLFFPKIAQMAQLHNGLFLELAFDLAKSGKQQALDQLKSCNVATHLLKLMDTKDKLILEKCLRLIRQLVQFKDDQTKVIMPMVIDKLLSFKYENLLYSQILNIIKLAYEVDHHFEQIVLINNARKEHPRSGRLDRFIGFLKENCIREEDNQIIAKSSSRLVDYEDEPRVQKLPRFD